MEIKVICECGTKYAFDVVPVDGHMPQAVKCPVCGANGTAQANAAIREALGIADRPPVATVSAETVPAEPTPAPAPSAPAAKPGAVRLSVQRPAAAPASHGEAVTVASFRPGAAAPVAQEASASGGTVWAARGKKALQLAWKGVLVLLCGLAMLAGFGGKKGRGLRAVTRIASSVIRANAADDETMVNLDCEDGVLLLIKHTNETEVAEACTGYWQDTHKKKVTFVATNILDLLKDENEENEPIVIFPAYHGCVQILGGLKWPKEDFEKLTGHLAQKFNTVGVAAREVEASGGYSFGVFEGGEKKFHAEMEMTGESLKDSRPSVTVEGEQWAREHGYKPGKDGFKRFRLADADRITRRLGFHMEDHGPERVFVMSEIASPPPTNRAVTNRAGSNRPGTNRVPVRPSAGPRTGKAP
jgi:hypothetical protein